MPELGEIRAEALASQHANTVGSALRIVHWLWKLEDIAILL